MGQGDLSVKHQVRNKSAYEATRFFALIFIILGFLVLAAASIGGFSSYIIFRNDEFIGGTLTFTIIIYIAIAFSGLFLIAIGQIMTAILDNADQTREILILMQDYGSENDLHEDYIKVSGDEQQQ